MRLNWIRWLSVLGLAAFQLFGIYVAPGFPDEATDLAKKIDEACKLIHCETPALAYKGYAADLKRHVNELIENESSFDSLLYRLKLFVPGYYELTLRGNVSGVPIIWVTDLVDGTGSIGLGANLKRQIQELYVEDFATYKATLSSIVNSLLKDDPILARTFLDAVTSLSVQDIRNEDGRTYSQIGALLLLIIVVAVNIRSISRRCLPLSQRALRIARAAAYQIEENPLPVAIVATACIVVGFFVAHGYNSYVGILGSIRYMAISVGPFELSFRWLVIFCLIVLFYAAWLLLRTKKRLP